MIYGVSHETVHEILTTMRTIAVIGVSPNPARPSNEVLGFLVAKRFETYPVNPWHVGGLIRVRPTCARLADLPARIDTVDVALIAFAVGAEGAAPSSRGRRAKRRGGRRDPGATRRTDGSLKELPRRRGRTTPSIAAPRNDGAAPSQPAANAITAAETVRIFGTSALFRTIACQNTKPSLSYEVMNDLSDIGRPGANEERRIASERRGICQCNSVLLNGRGGAENNFGPGGRRKPLKRLETAKKIQGKPSLFLGLFLRGLGPAWLNLVRLGSGVAHAFV